MGSCSFLVRLCYSEWLDRNFTRTVTSSSFLLKFWGAKIYSFQSNRPGTFSWTYHIHKTGIAFSLLSLTEIQRSFYIVILVIAL